MDQSAEYRELIKGGLSRRCDFFNRSGQNGLEATCVLDDESGQYLLIWIGWRNQRRVQITMLYVRLHEGKIWIETDDTEDGFATELLKAGVPNSDIVLAFHPPHLRQYTDFAVA